MIKGEGGRLWYKLGELDLKVERTRRTVDTAPTEEAADRASLRLEKLEEQLRTAQAAFRDYTATHDF